MIRLTFDRGTLVLKGATPMQINALQDARAWKWDPRIFAWRQEALNYWKIRTRLKEVWGDEFVDETPKPNLVLWPCNRLPTLEQGILNALDAFENAGRRGIVGLSMVKDRIDLVLGVLQKYGLASLILTHKQGGAYRWRQRIQESFGYHGGIVDKKSFDVRPVTISTYESAYIHMETLGRQFGMMIFDRAHQLEKGAFQEIALLSMAPYRLGLHDNRDLNPNIERLIGPFVYRVESGKKTKKRKTLAEIASIPVVLTEAERIKHQEADKIVTSFLKGRHGSNHGFTELFTGDTENPETRRARSAYFKKRSIEDCAENKLEAIETVFKRYGRKKTLIFAGCNRMAIRVSKRFLVPAILSGSKKKERLLVFNGFSQGRFPVVALHKAMEINGDLFNAEILIYLSARACSRSARRRIRQDIQNSMLTKKTFFIITRTPSLKRPGIKQNMGAPC